MAKFIVLHTPILHDGKRYEVGAEIELTAEQAENNAINLKAVEAVPKPPKNASKPEDEPKPEGEPKPEDAVTEDDVKLAEAKIAEAEQPKGNKK
ncbi:TPA: hypothetical protein PXF07_000053 [Mannheimia haemolytica]|uniref:DUF7210 domain-containing protein n=1 Tax=Mannheimia haemolytica TaxID=75985 RepID=A0A249A1M3_MANHA|nr:hypothetical protein [Mannheimia haemolytica]AWW72176.1 hypothetical protein C4O86_10480 [Pasteurellaceae bacterium 12565]AGI33466.1 hypothetical protein D650_21970 [Mannheimia haemolytica USDA-ARS-USMARC-183]AGK01617.1 hypothetical protein MHH_c11640 [Mannheimia haemolytica M42548]AGQ26431.1 hypothetical protein F382_10945 [Mannheimia haemolytica D153]AGR74369.1 hypothetical protein N220_03050 [Mannheimia haemolytica USMARC_2286]